ncbi:unnamed protein product [Litomosoides sigmodontis]|uniref:CCHC-type domain-containing protein n=1 Tax=Litomosoides sigmodontis TaxID=42156 RepID=A0A3P6UDW1_LITSI|nr:unnamed protein product [Litomosoides sigmodontis]
MSGPPPPTYVCNRCSQSGHWYKNCPMLNTRRTTGITMDELMETTSDDPLAMLHPSGKYVVPIMHWKARQKKPEVAKPEPEIREIPPELKCPICSQLLRDAVLTTCCGDSFCADCLQQRLLETPNAKCPGTNCFQTAVSADKLVPNLKMRQAVEAFKHGAVHSTAFESTNNSPRIDEQPAQSVSRVRIGLSGRPQQVQPAIIIQQQQQQPKQQQQQEAAAISSSQAQIQTSPPTYIVQPTTNMAIPATLQSQMTIKQFSGNTIIPSPGIASSQSQSKVIAPTVVVPNVQQLTVAPPPLPLAVNVHQPPPGYPAILAPAQPVHVTTSSSTESIASGTHTARSISAVHLTAPPLLLPPGVQPPPPGLSAVIYPRVSAPPPIKDAWDEYLERKDKESRQRAAVPASRRRRRSTRSTSYSSSSTSPESSSESSRSRSRSSSRDRNRSRRDKRRNDAREKYSRRRDSRSPFHSSYASTRYHRDSLTSSFNPYQHASSTATIGLPGASLIHHRIPSLLNNYCSSQYASNQLNQTTSYSSFSNGPSCRSSKTYLDERSRRHSPRSVQNRRRNESREKQNDRKERTEERKRGKDGDERTRREDRERRPKEDSDREEKRQKKDKYRRHQEKESKEIENATERRQGSAFKIEEKNAGTVDLKIIGVDGEAKKAAAALQIENKGAKNNVGDTENNVEKENDTVDEALPDETAAENGLFGFRVNHDDGSGAEAENENEGLDEEKGADNITTEMMTDKDRNEKKKHRRKKRKHRRHEGSRAEDDEIGRKKHKKHKRSKEEKEQRKHEKEKRREERRRRRQEKEAGRVNASENIGNKESEYEMCNVVTGMVNNGNENEMTVDVSVREVKKVAAVESVELTNCGLPAQKSEEKTVKESKVREAQEGYENGKSDGKERGYDSSSFSKNNERKNARGRLKHEKDKKRKRDFSRKRDESKDDSRMTRKRSDEKETRRNEDKDSRKEGDKFRKNDRNDEKIESRRLDNKEEKTKSSERELRRLENSEKVGLELRKESKHKQHGDKRKTETNRSDHKRPRLRSHGSRDEQCNDSMTDQKFLSETFDVKKVAEGSETDSVVRNETDPLLLSPKKSGLDLRTTSKAIDPVDRNEMHKASDQKRVDEIKISIEKELERKVEAIPASSSCNMPNLTVELKSGGEKRVTRENIFEGATPHFNARQKIKMILLSESERKAADRSFKKKSGMK